MWSSPRIAVAVLAAGVERVAQQRPLAERERVRARRLLGDLEQADALDVASACR